MGWRNGGELMVYDWGLWVDKCERRGQSAVGADVKVRTKVRTADVGVG